MKPVQYDKFQVEANLTVFEGLQAYFEHAGFKPDGGYQDKWVKLPFIGPLAFYFPNTENRRKAVKRHDINHVLTGYGTSYRDEARIGAWELASGCFSYGAAWFLNVLVLPIGLFLNPIQTWQAYCVGKTVSNAYSDEPVEAYYPLTVDSLKQKLGWQQPKPCNKSLAFIEFSALMALGILFSAAIAFCLWGPVIVLLAWLLSTLF